MFALTAAVVMRDQFPREIQLPSKLGAVVAALLTTNESSVSSFKRGGSPSSSNALATHFPISHKYFHHSTRNDDPRDSCRMCYPLVDSHGFGIMFHLRYQQGCGRPECSTLVPRATNDIMWNLASDWYHGVDSQGHLPGVADHACCCLSLP